MVMELVLRFKSDTYGNVDEWFTFGYFFIIVQLLSKLVPTSKTILIGIFYRPSLVLIIYQMT